MNSFTGTPRSALRSVRSVRPTPELDGARLHARRESAPLVREMTAAVPDCLEGSNRSVAIADSLPRMRSVILGRHLDTVATGTKPQAPTARKGWDSMALGFYFSPSGFTPESYDEVIRRLEEAGAGAPEGRSNHFALETNGEIQVFDVWESQEAFEAFGATLVPIMAELGADPGEPMVARVHNVIDG